MLSSMNGLWTIPWSTVAPLQRVQNAAARLVLGFSPRDHVSPALLELHWLPVYYRIQFKLGLLMYMAHNEQSPMYISDALTPVCRVPSHGRLRSAQLRQQTTWCQGHVLSSGREHSVFPGVWSGSLSPSHCELSIPSHRSGLL